MEWRRSQCRKTQRSRMLLHLPSSKKTIPSLTSESTTPQKSKSSLCGYKIPHPLEHTFILKIQTTPDTNPLDVFILESANIIRELGDLNKKFQVSPLSELERAGCSICMIGWSRSQCELQEEMEGN
ncbi:hypothetical protein BCR33DRAFT_378926 [Rhizoclosmatium globosum]|uniref:DNA-directed RNA polymerase RBP11-like dimerisation domain-containing protein n=1 Tax=Rhizoclosmatium globosum TaxID=329046 RepID=A0A1Y2BYT9_9FUNG|nr:hypothetical protein BCR33DRAFT_378926 [Rhizoclosmatium globosum]|eukprot:ORY39942.1 hypothetical protein BCR33DRAFT_378926 [Rhizoclosmatium globosum]